MKPIDSENKGEEIESAEISDDELIHDQSRKEALESLRRLARPFPPDFKFDREEANER